MNVNQQRLGATDQKWIEQQQEQECKPMLCCLNNPHINSLVVEIADCTDNQTWTM